MCTIKKRIKCVFYDNKKVIKMLCAFDIIPKTLYQIFDMTIKAMYMYMKTK